MNRSSNKREGGLAGYLVAAGFGVAAGWLASSGWSESKDPEPVEASASPARKDTEARAPVSACPRVECPSCAPPPSDSASRLQLDLCLASLQGERSASNFVLGEGQRPSEAMDAVAFEANGAGILGKCVNEAATLVATDCQSIPCSVTFQVEEGDEPDFGEVLAFGDCARDNFAVADASTSMESLIQLSTVECPDGSVERYFTAMAASAEELPQQLGAAYRIFSSHHLLRVHDAACSGAVLLATE